MERNQKLYCKILPEKSWNHKESLLGFWEPRNVAMLHILFDYYILRLNSLFTSSLRRIAAFTFFLLMTSTRASGVALSLRWAIQLLTHCRIWTRVMSGFALSFYIYLLGRGRLGIVQRPPLIRIIKVLVNSFSKILLQIWIKVYDSK